MGEERVSMDPEGLVLVAPQAPALLSFETKVSDHFVLAHHGIARCDEDGWILTVDGLVDHLLELSIGDLRRLEQHTVTAVLECAGDPEDPDRPTRFVSNARWGGVLLSDVLGSAGVRPEARYVWMRGIDWGTYAGVTNDSYLKDISLEKALTGDVVIAYEMNGEPLTPEHGFPLRAVVPGYYGTNSVKWLSHISAQSQRPRGLFTTRLYNTEVNGALVPVWGMAVNSCIVEPTDGTVLSTGPQEIRGWAWGERPITTVDISVDGGGLWQPAILDDVGHNHHGWRGFRLPWQPAAAGAHTILARATDATGATQPLDLHINQIQQVTVTAASKEW